MSYATHLTEEQLIRLLDHELSPAECAAVEIHLAMCDGCLDRYENLAELSAEVGRFVEAAPVNPPRQARARLVDAIRPPRSMKTTASHPGWKWGAIAAGIAAAALLVSHGAWKQPPPQPAPARHSTVTASVVKPEPLQSVAARGGTNVPTHAAKFLVQRRTSARRRSSASPQKRRDAFDSYIRLPYSDPSLSQAAGVVRVEMPVSALANAGLVRLPPGASDGMVQADVLLGMDGQPYGIKLVSKAGAK